MRPLAAILAGRRKKLPLGLYWSACTHCPNDAWTQPRKCTPQSNGRRRAIPTGNRGVPLWGIIRSAWCFPACWGIPLCQGFAIPKGPAPAHTACCACLPGETLHGETGAFSRARGLSALRGIFRRVGVSPFAEGSPSRRAPPQPALYVVPAFPARRSMGKPGGIPMWGHYPLYAVFPGVLGYLPVPRVRHPEGLRRNQHYMLCLSSRHDTPQKTGAFPRAGTIRSAWCFPACWGIPLCQGFAIPKGPAPAHTACCACLPGETLHGETGAFSRARGLSALRGISRHVGVSPFAEGSPSRRAPPQPALYVVSVVPARRSMGKPGHSLVRGLSALRGISRRVGYPLLPRVHPPKRLRRSPRCISHLPSRRDAAQIRLHRHIKRGGRLPSRRAASTGKLRLSAHAGFAPGRSAPARAVYRAYYPGPSQSACAQTVCVGVGILPPGGARFSDG